MAIFKATKKKKFSPSNNRAKIEEEHQELKEKQEAAKIFLKSLKHQKQEFLEHVKELESRHKSKKSEDIQLIMDQQTIVKQQKRQEIIEKMKELKDRQDKRLADKQMWKDRFFQYRKLKPLYKLKEIEYEESQKMETERNRIVALTERKKIMRPINDYLFRQFWKDQAQFKTDFEKKKQEQKLKQQQESALLSQSLSSINMNSTMNVNATASTGALFRSKFHDVLQQEQQEVLIQQDLKDTVKKEKHKKEWEYYTKIKEAILIPEIQKSNELLKIQRSSTTSQLKSYEVEAAENGTKRRKLIKNLEPLERRSVSSDQANSPRAPRLGPPPGHKRNKSLPKLSFEAMIAKGNEYLKIAKKKAKKKKQQSVPQNQAGPLVIEEMSMENSKLSDGLKLNTKEEVNENQKKEDSPEHKDKSQILHLQNVSMDKENNEQIQSTKPINYLPEIAKELKLDTRKQEPVWKSILKSDMKTQEKADFMLSRLKKLDDDAEQLEKRIKYINKKPIQRDADKEGLADQYISSIKAKLAFLGKMTNE